MFGISEANSMGFSLVDSNLPNRENTLSYNEKYAAKQIKTYCQKWQADSVVTIQLYANVATVPTVQVYQPELTTPITATLVSSYLTDTNTDNWRYYFEFDVDFSNYTNKIIQIKVTQGAIVYLSEYQKGEDITEDLANGYMLRCDYQNSAKPSDNTNFTIDYTTGIANYFYFEAVLRKPAPQGEDNVFDNLDQKVLLEAQVFRAMILETDPLPTFLTEKILLAGKHYYFAINTLQFTSDGIPDIGESESNHSPLTWTLIQKDVLGFNTDNRELIVSGGTTMDAVIIRKDTAIISGAWSFTVPKEYMLHVIYASHTVGSAANYVMKVGTTIGGDEILGAAMGAIPLAGAQNPIPFIIHEQNSWTADTVIYVTITGVGAIADVRAQLILSQ